MTSAMEDDLLEIFFQSMSPGDSNKGHLRKS